MAVSFGRSRSCCVTRTQNHDDLRPQPIRGRGVLGLIDVLWKPGFATWRITGQLEPPSNTIRSALHDKSSSRSRGSRRHSYLRLVGSDLSAGHRLGLTLHVADLSSSSRI